MANGNEHRQEGGWGSWALIVFLFAIGIWPVALFLLFSKIFGEDKQQKRQAPPPLRTDAPQQARGGEDVFGQVERDLKNSAREMRRDLRNSARGTRREERADSRARTAARNVVKSPREKKSNARTLKMIGLIMLAVGVASAMNPAEMVLSGYIRTYIWELLQYSAVAVGGAGMLLAGVRMDAAMRRYGRYLAVMGEESAVEVGNLARKLGYSERRVEKDLQKMIDKDYFGDQAYLNVEMGYLFRSSQADSDLRAQKDKAAEAARPAPKEAEEGYSGILRNIRRANDRIADPVLTAKIDQLEAITAKIFRAVEEDPKKAGRIDTFLNYYLPTTQKLLDAYAEFDAAGVEGENLRQAKQRIEKTMDSIVEGFEHQLDELYKSDAMDVDSDIRVMETMLHRDTASVERDFGLGGAPKAPDVPAQAAQARDVDLGGVAAQQEE